MASATDAAARRCGDGAGFAGRRSKAACAWGFLYAHQTRGRFAARPDLARRGRYPVGRSCRVHRSRTCRSTAARSDLARSGRDGALAGSAICRQPDAGPLAPGARRQHRKTARLCRRCLVGTGHRRVSPSKAVWRWRRPPRARPVCCTGRQDFATGGARLEGDCARYFQAPPRTAQNQSETHRACGQHRARGCADMGAETSVRRDSAGRTLYGHRHRAAPSRRAASYRRSADRGNGRTAGGTPGPGKGMA